MSIKEIKKIIENDILESDKFIKDYKSDNIECFSIEYEEGFQDGLKKVLRNLNKII